MEKRATSGTYKDFQSEFLACWQRLPNKGFFFALLAAWLALFQFLGNSTFGFIPSPSLLRWMYDVYVPKDFSGNQDDVQGLIIPFVVVGIFWWKRKELMALSLRMWWPALLLLGGAVVLHILGYMVQQPRISIIGLFVGIYGLMGLAWGREWLGASFFPFFLFGFCIPLGTLSLSITFPLRLLVCHLVEWVCHFILAIDIVRDGTALIDPTGHYQYEVAAACSGMRSLVTTLALALIYAWLSLRKPWKRAILIASAFPLAVFGNLLRMLTIVIAAEIWGAKAGNYVHEGGPLGIISLLPYIPAFGGLFLLAHWLRERKAEPSLTEGQRPA